MDELHRLDEIGLYISVAGNPAVSVPCAFFIQRLPIGMQIVAPHHWNAGVLCSSYALNKPPTSADVAPSWSVIYPHTERAATGEAIAFARDSMRRREGIGGRDSTGLTLTFLCYNRRT